MDTIGDAVNRLSAWRDRNIVPVRLTGLSLLAAFFCYHMLDYYNRDMKDLNAIAEKKSQIGKELQRREDLAHNLAELSDNYVEHERILFRHVSDVRAGLQSLEAMNGAPSAAQSMKIEQDLLKLAALAEQYPDLKAERLFHDLMDMTELTENRIADRMKDYLEIIYEYNVDNQSYWNNCFFYPLARVILFPAYWEYYYTEQLLAPLVPLEKL